MGKRIKWAYTFSRILDAINALNDHLGWLEYERTGKFMHWCWHQVEGIRMSPGYLEEVRIKQKSLAKKTRVYVEDGEEIEGD